MRLFLIIFFLVPKIASSNDVLIAVATNFKLVLDQITAEFEEVSSHQINIVSGSTGLLYNQIINGAPYDLFLSADQIRPILLEDSGKAVSGSRFTYAEGRLVLWIRNSSHIDNMNLQRSLHDPDLKKLAIANPELAPYGAAARQYLLHLGIWNNLSKKIVLGENIGQVFALIATGNVDIALLSKSQVLINNKYVKGNFFIIPPENYQPILQDAILLKYGAKNKVAKDFLLFLRSQSARKTIKFFGYEAP